MRGERKENKKNRKKIKEKKNMKTCRRVREKERGGKKSYGLNRDFFLSESEQCTCRL